MDNDDLRDGYYMDAKNVFSEAGETISNTVNSFLGDEKPSLTHSYLEDGEKITLNIPKKPGETVRDNHKAYGDMHTALNTKDGAIKSQWFKAAYEVTSYDAIGSVAFYIPNGPYLTNNDEDYLKHVHHELAEINYNNFQSLYHGKEIEGLEGLRGKALDYALVELEQNHVERLTNEYFKQNPSIDSALRYMD